MIYLDNNATTLLAPPVLEAMLPLLGPEYGNPSSSHELGRAARQAVENSREAVADLLGASSPGEIVFTSGGTESDNWAIAGSAAAAPDKRHIVTTSVEHEAVRRPFENFERNGYAVTWLEVDGEGSLDLEALRSSITEETAAVSIMLANNETGILFPVAEAAEIVKSRSNALFHVDAVNAAGKISIDLKNSQIDLLSVSAHKFHGPKGVGALYVREGVVLQPMLSGGGQEAGRRAGTEAVHQIAGLGAAAELVRDLSEMDRVRELRDRLENEILDRIPNSRLNGTADAARRLPNTSNISFEGTNGEAILARLNDEGIFVSTGSACNSETHAASPVLQAMNIPYSMAMGSIRFSLGRFNLVIDVDRVLEVLPGIVGDLRSMSGLAA